MPFCKNKKLPLLIKIILIAIIALILGVIIKKSFFADINSSKSAKTNASVQGQQEVNASQNKPSMDFKSLPQNDE